ncbi:MAG: hypothetical protein MJ244_00310 [Clostridia bacterium]|nr:hypothetical protein [Clostridia bacterium]
MKKKVAWILGIVAFFAAVYAVCMFLIKKCNEIDDYDEDFDEFVDWNEIDDYERDYSYEEIYGDLDVDGEFVKEDSEPGSDESSEA